MNEARKEGHPDNGWRRKKTRQKKKNQTVRLSLCAPCAPFFPPTDMDQHPCSSDSPGPFKLQHQLHSSSFLHRPRPLSTFCRHDTLLRAASDVKPLTSKDLTLRPTLAFRHWSEGSQASDRWIEYTPNPSHQGIETMASMESIPAIPRVLPVPCQFALPICSATLRGYRKHHKNSKVEEIDHSSLFNHPVTTAIVKRMKTLATVNNLRGQRINNQRQGSAKSCWGGHRGCYSRVHVRQLEKKYPVLSLCRHF